jgi:hypothetical protein
MRIDANRSGPTYSWLKVGYLLGEASIVVLFI